MTYARVIPRDLFNEGDLLNCLGRLWIKLDENRNHRAVMVHGHRDGPFQINQNDSDGSIRCRNVMLSVGGVGVYLFRPLNARSKWPLWASAEEDDIRVFDEETGDLSPEFLTLIGAGS